MTELIKYLSGNVNGGIWLYLSLVILIFLVLFSISRRNDLFTPRLFKRWFIIVWLALTAGYIALWFSDPPPAAYHRYSTLFNADRPGDNWLADYFREETTRQLKPYRNKTDYYYLQRWNYTAGLPVNEKGRKASLNIAEKLPLDEILIGTVRRNAGGYELHLSMNRFPGQKLVAEKTFPFKDAQPDKIIADMRRWISAYLPIRDKMVTPGLANRDFIEGREAFYRGDHAESAKVFTRLQKQFPESAEVQRWYQFNRIYQAAVFKKAAGPQNPFEFRKKRWQKMIAEARSVLVNQVKENIASGNDDPYLNSILAYSFMLEEYYGDAEEFLKIGYNANPFSIDLLERLLLLHPSRFSELGFDSDAALRERILTICPLHENVLAAQVDHLLLDAPVEQAPSVTVKAIIERVLSLNPNSVTGLILQGRYLNTMFDYNGAMAAFQKADSLRPADPLLKFDLGVTAFKLEDDVAAEAFFQTAIDLNDYLDAHLYLGAIYKNRGEYEKALERFRYRVANKTGDDDYYAVQAMKGIRECLKALNIPIPQ